jgi:hypothetical protein
MKLVLAAMCVLAAVAAPVLTPAAAHAQPPSRQFLSPSGNVGCQLGTDSVGAAYAWCKVDEHAWAAPDSGYCPAANVPGAIGEPRGDDLQLSAGKSPCLGFVMSQLFFTGEYAPATLGYGQQQSVGTITCAVEQSGVTCTDSSTGHFFVASRDAYQLG